MQNKNKVIDEYSVSSDFSIKLEELFYGKRQNSEKPGSGGGKTPKSGASLSKTI